jgi:hypothetical protein
VSKGTFVERFHKLELYFFNKITYLFNEENYLWFTLLNEQSKKNLEKIHEIIENNKSIIGS